MTGIDDVLTADGFGAWLTSEDDGGFVGRTCSFSMCPLAKFLQANGFPKARVGRLVVYPTGAGQKIDLPAWALTFVSHIDATRPIHRRITAGECRQALASETAK